MDKTNKSESMVKISLCKGKDSQYTFSISCNLHLVFPLAKLILTYTNIDRRR